MSTIKMKRIRQSLIFVLSDAFFITITYIIATLMFKVLGTPIDKDLMMIALPIITLFHLLIFASFGMYNMLINHIGFEDVLKISIVTLFSNLAIVVFIWLTGIEIMHKSAYFFIIIAEIFFFIIPRVTNRIILYFKINWDWNRALGRRTLIIGAGSAGEAVLKEIYRNKDLKNMPMGYIDNDETKIGSRLSGIKILGPIDHINEYIELYEIEEVIIAINNFPPQRVRELTEHILNKNVRIRKMQNVTTLDDNTRPVITDIRIEELLNRDEIKLDSHEIGGYIKGETVLVTGGGGSIGSELCRQIVTFEPKKLIIFDIYENNAYDVQQELIRYFRKTNSKVELEVRIGSVYNQARLESVFKAFKPTLVFHAAAYKHVPLMEDSAVESVRTNVIGTYYTAALSKLYKVKKFVLVSSDKAVRATNIMGATKRFAELIIEQQQNGQRDTIFSAVRFGNVLGSNGSVIPLFKKQIEAGGPVTVTHKEITRYFMTIPEAVGLILQCGVFSKGREVFILDMGEPVKIIDLAERMIRLNGLKPYEDIDIEFTGLRPGEKLYEELLVDHEHGAHHTTAHEKIFIEQQRAVDKDELLVADMIKRIDELSNEQVKQAVADIIRSYHRNGD